MSNTPKTDSNKERLRKLILLRAKIEKRSPVEILRELQYQLEERELARKN